MNPPPFKGGQGRSVDDVKGSAAGVGFAILAALLLWLLIAMAVR